MKRLLAAVLALAAPPALADVGLPAFLSDHVVLQRGPKTRLWGTAEAGERVTVSLAGLEATTTADRLGRWTVEIGPLVAGGPHELTVRGPNNELRVGDVMIGEVWLASGQSNMEFPLERAKDAEREIAGASFPAIREFAVPRQIAKEPADDVTAKWVVCTPQTAGPFSAVAFFFAREVHQALGVPVGIVHSSWGGTPAEAWTSRATLTADRGLRPLVEKADRIASDPSAAAAYERAMAEWEAKNVARDEGDQGSARGWARPDFDDREWKRMRLPGAWEPAGLDVDGALWFRRTIDVPAAWAGHDLPLALGAIDDFDTTWYDGVQVGATGQDTPGYWAYPRRYVVPGRLVHAGRSVIAVRAFDRAGDGGFTGPAAVMQIGSGPAALSLAGDWSYAVERALPSLHPDWGSQPVSPLSQNAPTVLYNAMIAPLRNATLAGALWYQGEANATRAYEYRHLLPTMIDDWRRAFRSPEMPFLFVQLANYMARAPEPGESEWAELREAQLRTLSVPRTGMAVAIDVGEADDIHPKDKQSVGHRLALVALARVYGQDGPWSGPVLREARREGAALRLAFDHADGLRAQDGGAIAGFAIAGADRKFVAADARVEGDALVVTSPKVPEPTAVRYGWADNPRATLVNGAGLPASPFRTDDWPGLTAATAVP